VRQDFLATTIHDVQQPLSVVKARAQLALRQLGPSQLKLATVVSSLHSIVDEADRLSQILSGLAEASRLGLGAFELRRSEVDLRELVQHAIDRQPPQAAAQFQLRVDGDPVQGEWDRSLLERVVDNVLSNAVKYSPPGSPIDIAINDRDGIAQLAVHDHGIGLSPDDVERVFERYRRAEGAVQLGIRGQGLGLYLARGVVEAHGGRMWLESPGPGFGATVFVRLPCQAERVESRADMRAD